MSRISPAPADRIAEFEADFDKSKKQRGYVPNSWYTLVRKPRVFRAFRDLRDAVMGDPGEVPPALDGPRACMRDETAVQPPPTPAYINDRSSRLIACRESATTM